MTTRAKKTKQNTPVLKTIRDAYPLPWRHQTRLYKKSQISTITDARGTEILEAQGFKAADKRHYRALHRFIVDTVNAMYGRDELILRLNHLLATEFVNSCAPLSRAAGRLRDQLNEVGVAPQDHLLFCMNHGKVTPPATTNVAKLATSDKPAPKRCEFCNELPLTEKEREHIKYLKDNDL